MLPPLAVPQAAGGKVSHSVHRATSPLTGTLCSTSSPPLPHQENEGIVRTWRGSVLMINQDSCKLPLGSQILSTVPESQWTLVLRRSEPQLVFHLRLSET